MPAPDRLSAHCASDHSNNADAPDSRKNGSQRFGIAKLQSPVSKSIFKQCLKIIGAQALFPTDQKRVLQRLLCLQFIRKARSSFSVVNKKVSNVFEEPETECMVSISIIEDNSNC